MTSKQIARKLEQADIDLSSIKIEKDEVTVCVGYRETNNNGRTYGTCDERQTKILANKVAKILGWKGGYRNGYGAQILVARSVNIDSDNCQ